MAIFEYSSSNGYSSFKLYYECRSIQIQETGDEIQSHFSYLVESPCHHEACCKDRGYENWEVSNSTRTWCLTTFQGVCNIQYLQTVIEQLGNNKGIPVLFQGNGFEALNFWRR